MNIGLIDVDCTSYPNLVLMKLSAWHKSQGDTVDLLTPNDVLEGARKFVYPDLRGMNHLYGVGKFEDADMAWELYTTVRHCMAWAKNPDGGCTVDYDPPISMRGNEIAKCTVKGD